MRQLTGGFCDFQMDLTKTSRWRSLPAVFMKIYSYLLNLLRLFLDICYCPPDTFSSLWEMFYVTIIVRREYDNLFLKEKNI